MTLSTYWEAASKDRVGTRHHATLSPATEEVRESNGWNAGVVAVVHVDGAEVGLTVSELEELSTAAERLARDHRERMGY